MCITPSYFYPLSCLSVLPHPPMLHIKLHWLCILSSASCPLGLVLSVCVIAVQLCPTLCDSMNCSISDFSALHYLLEFPLTHVHPTISSSVICFSSCLQSFPASGSFPVSQLFASGGQIIGASASASVLPMSIDGWVPLELTGLLSLCLMCNSSKIVLHQDCFGYFWLHELPFIL